MSARNLVAVRRTLRVPLPVQLFCADAGSMRFLGYLGNVSASGLFVQCSNPRAIGRSLQLEFRLPGNLTVGCRSAEIVWTRSLGGREGRAPGMGMRFTEIAESARSLLKSFCSK